MPVPGYVMEIFVLKVFQSVEFNRPLVVAEASGMVRAPVLDRLKVPAVPDKESETAVAILEALPTKMLADESVEVSFVLNVFQSVEDKYPELDVVAWAIEPVKALPESESVRGAVPVAEVRRYV